MAQAQSLRLTEFLAVNSNGLTDEEGTVQPWIEIWNPSAGAKVTLTNTKLSNGTTTWTFPATEIMPDERLIVFASGKNRKVATAPLHTDFTIPPGGGTISFLRSDNSVMSQLAYPAQEADVSWGRDEWDVATVPAAAGRYSSPTPGERNNYSGPGVSGKVVISEPSRAYTGTLTVSLSLVEADPETDPEKQTVIRYTLNGTAPNAASIRYTGPFSVTTTQVVRARAFKPGLLPGETETAGYLLLNSTTQNFSSTMPLSVISNFSGGEPPATGDQSAFVWVWEPSPSDSRSRFSNPPVLATRCVIDRRGSSTVDNDKFNLNVEFRKSRDDDDRDEILMGMPAAADWVFHAPFDYDRSLLHNPFAYALSNLIGRYASRVNFAEVFVDTNGGPLAFSGANSGDYFGVYNVMEKVRRGDDRVDIKKLDLYDNDAVKKTGGYIWKIDRTDAGDTGVSAGGQAWVYYYPKEIEIKSLQRDPQEQYLTNYLISTNNALQSASWNNPVTGYAAWLDVPAAIDHHLINVWTFNVDGLRLSGFWTKERGGKIAPGPVWDFDRALSSTDTRDDNPATWRSTIGDQGTDFFNYPWWNRLFLDPDFYQKYVDRWQSLRRGAWSPAGINALLDSLNGKISAEGVTRDLARWRLPKRSWTSPFTGQVFPASQAAEVQQLKDYLQQRANFFDSQWVGPVSVSVPGGTVSAGTQVTLTGPANSVIYYTINGGDPRPPGGAVPSGGVLTYDGNPITINAATRIRARAYKASHTALTGANRPALVCKWSGLTSEQYTTDRLAAAGDLVVTELNYHPADPKPAELTSNPVLTDNDFEFIELRNVSLDTVNLAGVKIGDAVTFTFAGEQSQSLPAGGYAVIASNPTAFMLRYPGFQGVLAGPWTGNLSNGGEPMRVLASAGAVIFSMTYSDVWAPESDGNGRTMAVYRSRAAEAAFSAADNWRASAVNEGSPGASDPNRAPEISIPPVFGNATTGAPLAAAVQDDELPEPVAAPELQWSKVSGPGDVTFDSAVLASTTAHFTLPGIYVLKLTANDTLASNSLEMTVYVQDTLAAWLERNPDIGEAGSDFESDGLSNLAEFALLTDARAPDAGAAFSFVREETGVVLMHKMQSAPHAPVVTVQGSADLENFQTLTPQDYTRTILSDDGLIRTIKIIIPQVPGTVQRYFRLHIAVPAGPGPD